MMNRIASALSRRLFPPTETLDGYEHPELVDVVFRKTFAYRPEGSWNEKAATVLDFGGGCGLHFREANSPTVRWAVVETPAMVERARELSSLRLQFFTDIGEAADWLGLVDLMHSNGALQFAPDPVKALRQLSSILAKQMLFRRVYLSEATEPDIQVSYLGDNGPGSIRVREKIVRYPRQAIAESNFLRIPGYSIVERGPDWFRFERA